MKVQRKWTGYERQAGVDFLAQIESEGGWGRMFTEMDNVRREYQGFSVEYLTFEQLAQHVDAYRRAQTVADLVDAAAE